MGKKLPTVLERELAKKAGEGLSNRAVATWLRDRHGIAMSHQALGKHLKGLRKQHDDATTRALRKAAERRLEPLLDHLEKLLEETRAMQEKQVHDSPMWLKYALAWARIALIYRQVLGSTEEERSPEESAPVTITIQEAPVPEHRQLAP